MCFELESSGIRVSVGDCRFAVSLNVGDGVRGYQTGKTVHVHAKTLQGWSHDARCARPLFCTIEILMESHYKNWITQRDILSVIHYYSKRKT